MNYRELGAYRQALLDMLRFDQWRHPCAMTLTFKQRLNGAPLTRDIAVREVRHFLNRLNRKLVGTRQHNNGVRLPVAIVFEWTEDKRLHCHGMIDCRDEQAATGLHNTVRDLWQRKTAWGYQQTKVDAHCDFGWADYMLKHRDKPKLDEAIQFQLWELPN